MTKLQDFQQRVVDEANDLRGKIDRLDAFIRGQVFAGLDAAEKGRLRRQSHAMDVYHSILRERIAAFDAPPPETDVGKRVNKIVVEHLGIDHEKVVDTADWYSDLGADSLDVVELVMAFEAEFGIEIDDDTAEKLLTVGDAKRWLEQNAPKGATARARL